jgi:hypothetical protein
MKFLDEDWDEAMLAHAAADSPFRDATRFAQNPEALGAVSTASLSRWQRDLDEPDKRIFKRTAGPLLVDLTDARPGALVWRGAAEAGLAGVVDKQRQMEETIDRVVARIFAKLPSRS